MTRDPLVTVYIPTHNRVNVLARALESVWRQRGADYEIVVVDDASVDATPDLLERHSAAGNLRWYRNSVPVGASAARNIAIQMARGKYITGLDDDDEMCSGRIAKLLAAIKPPYAFVCASDWITSAGVARLRIVPRRIDDRIILSRNVVGNQIFAERSKILECNGFDETLPSAEDYDLWIRMILKHGPAHGLITPLQRIHTGRADSISRSAARRPGDWMVYRKYAPRMTSDSRRAHIYNLRRRNGHPTRIPKDMLYWAYKNRIRLIWHAIHDLLKLRAR